MKTGDFIASLAKQVGLEDNDDLKLVIDKMTSEIPDEMAGKIQSSLLTVDAAKASPDIINHFFKTSLDPVDERLVELAKDAGLDDGFLHNLKTTKSTYKRMDSVMRAVKEAHKVALEKAKETASPGDKEGLQEEINKLNGELAVIKDTHIPKTEHEKLVEEYNGKIGNYESQMLDLQKRGLFSGVEWAMDVPPEVNVTTAKSLFDQELAKRGVSLVNDNGTLKLETKEGSEYFVDNKPITPGELASSVLSQHKLLKVTQTNGTPTPPANIPVNGVDPSVADAVRKAQQVNAEILEHSAQV